MFDSWHTLTAGGPYVDVFGRPGCRMLKTVAANCFGCPTTGQNLETGQLSRHYIAKI